VYDTEACQIGKPINWYAVSENLAARDTGNASGKGGWIEDSAWKF
jgi:hypothetical protein